MSAPLPDLIAATVASLDRVCCACLAATDEATWTLLHRGRACPVAVRCDHPEHRRGTRGGLRRNQEVCMNCGEIVLKRKR